MESTVVLLGAARTRNTPPSLIGIALDANAFISFVLPAKLNEAAGDDFILAVTGRDRRQIVYATGETSIEELKQSKDLWVLPRFSLWVRLTSGTIEEVAGARLRETLVLIVALDLLLLGGVWLVFRLVRREIELTRLKSDFISSVSHELRTPLSLIRMSAETLQLGRVSGQERTQEHHQIIVRETDRLTRLVNNVLFYSRLERGKKKLELVEADLNVIVRTTLNEYQTEFSRRGFAVQTEFANELPAASLNAEAVSEALLNLLDNGMKFSEGKKSLRVATGSSRQEVYVEVQDFGIGIPPSCRRRFSNGFIGELRGRTARYGEAAWD
jgi:two-component system phosphate regulon sensor histidine kinase PhoR